MPSPSLVVSCTLIRRVPLRCGRHQPEGRGGLHRGSMVTAPGLKPFRLQWVCRGCMTGLRTQRTCLSEAEKRGEVRFYAAGPLVEQAEASAVPRVHVFAPLRHLPPLDRGTKAVPADSGSVAELVSKAATQTAGSSPIPRPNLQAFPGESRLLALRQSRRWRSLSFSSVRETSPLPS